MRNFVQRFLLLCCFTASLFSASGQDYNAVDDVGLSVPSGSTICLNVLGNDDIGDAQPGDVVVQASSEPIDENGDPVNVMINYSGTDVAFSAFKDLPDGSSNTLLAAVGLVSFEYQIFPANSDFENDAELVLNTPIAQVYVYITPEDSEPPVITCPVDTVLLCAPEPVCEDFSEISTSADVATFVTQFVTDQGVVGVYGYNPFLPLSNLAAVISTSPAPTADPDLGSPHTSFGGTGVGAGGGPGLYQNGVPIGNVLIVNTDSSPTANDQCCNGISDPVYIEFDFSAMGTVTLNNMDIFDLDDAFQANGAGMELYDASNFLITTVQPPATGDNGTYNMFIGVSGVKRAKYIVNGSGSVASICFTVDGNPLTGRATATDNGLEPTIRFFDDIDTLCEDVNVINRTWRAIDCAGNISTCTQIITSINDTVAPVVIFCPEDVDVDCTGGTSPAETGGVATFDDACPYTLNVVMDDVTLGNSCEYTITRTWTASDTCMNTATCVQVITVTDDTGPDMTCPADATVECDVYQVGYLDGTATATDECNEVALIGYDDVTYEGNCPNEFLIRRNWSATDECDNTSTCNQNINVLDTTPPEIDCPADMTIECGSEPSVDALGSATASDLCGSADVTHMDMTAPGNCPQERVITRTWKATDACGLMSECDQTIEVFDTTPPALTCPDDEVVECDGEGNTAQYDAWLAQFSATDNCDTEITENFEMSMTTSGGMGNPTGLTVCKPDFSDLSDMMLNGSTAGLGNPVNFGGQDVLRLTNSTGQGGSAFLTDAVSLAADASFSTYFTFQITDNVGATDGADGIQGADGIVFVVQTNSNTAGGTGGGIGYFGIPNSVGVEFDTWYNGQVDGNHVGIDINGSTTSVAHASVSPHFNNGSIWSAWVDYDGNTDNLEVRVVEGDGAARPAAALVSHTVDLVGVLGQTDAFVGFTSGTGAAGGDHDIRSWALNNEFNPISGCDKVITIEYTATDDCGNAASCTKTFTIKDTTPPVITCPADVTVECSDYTSCFADVVIDATTAPNCNAGAGFDDPANALGAPNYDGNAGSPGLFYSMGDLGSTLTLGFTGNSLTNDGTGATDLIIYEIGPAIESTDVWLLPADAATANALTNLGIPEDSDGFFDFGNVIGATSSIDIDALTGNPVAQSLIFDQIKLINPINSGCGGVSGPDIDAVCALSNIAHGNYGTATAIDDCDQEVVIILEDLEGGTNCIATVTRTWTATDDCDNTSTCVQTVTITDELAPVIVCPLSMVVECDDVTAELGTATADDACNDVADITFEDDTVISQDCPNASTVTRTWTATDECDNSSTCVQTITYVDTDAPDFTCAVDITIECDESSDPSNTGMTTATDNCGLSIVDHSDATDNDNCLDVAYITRTWTIEDECGNNTTCTQFIRIMDRVAPDLTCPADMEVECGMDFGPGVTGFGSATDACDDDPTVTPTGEMVPKCGNTFTMLRTWTATDCSGNSTSCLQTIEIVDTTPPTINCPADQAIECDAYDPNQPFGDASATDICDAAVDVTFEDVQAAGDCVDAFTITRTWTATDDCDNTATCVQTISVDDNTAPECEDVTIELDCTDDSSLAANPYASATDNCDDDMTYVLQTDNTEPNGDCPQNVNITRKWIVFDNCLNTNSCVQTIEVRDTDAPDFTCAVDITIECDESSDPSNTGKTTATDNCGLSIVDHSDATDNDNCLDVAYITRTWTIEDECGNNTTCTQFIRIMDRVAPEITCPADATVECNSSIDPMDLGYATATDNCDTDPTIEPTGEMVPNCGNTFTMNRTWTATDCTGNSTTCLQVIEVIDTIPPVLACPESYELECYLFDFGGFFTLNDITFEDNCGRVFIDDVTVETPGSCPNEYSVLVTFTATDECDNTSTCSVTVNVVDTEGPIINCPDVNSVECSDDLSPAALGSASATDYCGEASTPTYEDYYCNLDDVTVGFTGAFDQANWTIDAQGNSSVTPLGQEVELVGNDDNGNTPNGDANYSIVFPISGFIAFAWDYETLDGPFYDPFGFTIDGSFTSLTRFGNGSVQSGIGSAYVEAGQTFSFTQRSSDACCNPGISVVVQIITVEPSIASPADLDCERYILKRVWTSEDDCGNESQCVQAIFVDDTTGPDLMCAADITIECDDSSDPSNTGMTTATDACSVVTDITFEDNTDNDQCLDIAYITRTWTATDACGNESTCTQNIRVKDRTAPDLTCPADTEVECGMDFGPGVTGFASATDACDDDPTVTPTGEMVPKCGNTFTMLRTWTATDCSGNSTNCVQTIEIVDTTPPTITFCPADQAIECDAYDPNQPFGDASATDICDAVVDVTFEDIETAGDCEDAFTITRTWTATDDCDNTATCVQTISVDDNTAPECEDVTIELECTDDSSLGANPYTSATDNCDDDLTYVLQTNNTEPNGDCPQNVNITRKWIVFDNCLNTNSCTQTIEVRDTEGPDVTCPTDLTIECDADTSPANTGMASATDNCDSNPMISYTDVTIAEDCGYTIERTWSAVDACGNVSEGCTQTIRVLDRTDPVITCPGPITLECPADLSPDNTGYASATDNCTDEPVITHTDAREDGACPQSFTITRTWKATDECGNASTCDQVIIVTDTTPPTITYCPADEEFECDVADAGIAGLDMASATDACDEIVDVTFEDVEMAGDCADAYTLTRTWTATDDCDNTATCVQTISVDDTTNPTCYDVTVELDCEDDTSVDANPYTSATDNCDDELDYVKHGGDAFEAGNCDGNYDLIRRFVVIDNCGNTTSCFQTIEVRDTEGPTVTCPENIEIECDVLDQTPATTGMATATDNCSATIIEYSDVTIADPDCGYTIERTFTTRDDCGNAGESCTQLIRVTDTTAPVITCPADLTMECDDDRISDGQTEVGGAGAAVAGINVSANTVGLILAQEFVLTAPAGAKVTDVNVSMDIDHSWIGDLEIDLVSPNGTVVRILKDPEGSLSGFGNEENVSATFDDEGAPFFAATTSSSNTPEDCNSEYLTIASISGTIQPQVDPLSNFDGDDAGGTWTLNINDDAGGDGICIHNLSIAIEWEKEGELMVVDGEATATDNCTEDVAMSYEDEIIPGSCENEYTVKRTWKATDDCMNMSTCVQLIEVSDNTAPEIECPADVTAECDAIDDVLADALSPSYSDNCSAVTVDPVDVREDGDCPNNYTIVRTWTATDACDNSSTCEQRFEVSDNTAPMIVCPADVTIGCDESADVVMQVGIETVSVTPVVAIPDNGVTIVDIEVSGVVGEIVDLNLFVDIKHSWTGDVVILLESPTGAICPITLADQVCGSLDDFNATFDDEAAVDVGDICNGTPPAISGSVRPFDPLSMFDGENPNGTWKVHVSDVDGGITGTVQELGLIIGHGTTGLMSAAAMDNCSDDVEVTWEDVTIEGECPVTEVIKRTFTATDECDNTSTCVQVITKVISEGPSIECPDDITANADKFECWKDFTIMGSIEIGVPEEEVQCNEAFTIVGVRSDNGATNVDTAFLDPYLVGTTTITWTVTGLCSDMSDECEQTVTIVDSQPPTVVCKKIAVALNDDEGLVFVPDGFMWEGVYDNCTGEELLAPTITVAQNIFSCTDLLDPSESNEVFVEICATDEAGNVGCCFTTVKIQDNFDPIAECQDVTVEIDPNTNTATVDVIDVDAGSTDNTDACELGMVLDTSEFTEAGDHIVEMTVTDYFGNTATCTSTVTVTGGPLGGGLLVSSKVWFEGSMNPSGTAMVAQIEDLLPLSQPYASIHGYHGTETVTEIPTGVVDWVLVQLRDQNDPSIVLAERAGFLMESGLIADLDGVNPVNFGQFQAGNYYLAILHRNHLSLMSNLSVQLVAGNVGFHDFTTGSSMGGDSQKALPSGEYAAWCGDLNADGIIDASDRSIAWNMRNTIGYEQADATLDGIVDASERSVTWNNRNKISGLPQ